MGTSQKSKDNLAKIKAAQARGAFTVKDTEKGESKKATAAERAKQDAAGISERKEYTKKLGRE